MAENVTIARPYAEAAFQLASAGNALGPWSESTRSAGGRRRRSANAGLHRRSQAPAAAAGWAFPRCCRGRTVCRTAELRPRLVDNERLQVLPEIRDLFVALKNEHEGVKEANITSAFPMDDVTLKALVADLETASRPSST